MFIIALTYIAPVEAVDRLMDDHRAWLDANREAGLFFAWGRKVPRDGGVILSRGDSREAIEAIAASDPFVTGGVARADVIEWAPTFAASDLAEAFA